ncbi:hypothetical protein H4582DRAFT_1917714 [Lactarius indigo]|nr:hypothetical protein H4582DRAFT_1917714 [Lactarius indigo]
MRSGAGHTNGSRNSHAAYDKNHAPVRTGADVHRTWTPKSLIGQFWNLRSWEVPVDRVAHERRYALVQQRNDQGSQSTSGELPHVKGVSLQRENEAGVCNTAAFLDLGTIQRVICSDSQIEGDGRILPFRLPDKGARLLLPRRTLVDQVSQEISFVRTHEVRDDVTPGSPASWASDRGTCRKQGVLTALIWEVKEHPGS